jgi:hypothetical protein
MIVEYAIVIALYTQDGISHMTSRRGFESREECEQALRADLKASFSGLPAVKGHCIDFPVRPAGLPEPKAAEKKEGRDA